MTWSLSSATMSTQSKGRARKETPNSRLLRKRETDRRAQRANRERTKRRIELLEEEIKRLRSQDRNTVFRDLTQTIENQQTRCDNLERTLFRVLSIVRTACESIQCIVHYSSSCSLFCEALLRETPLKLIHRTRN